MRYDLLVLGAVGIEPKPCESRELVSGAAEWSSWVWDIFESWVYRRTNKV